jgi:hypothetical protein
MGRERFPVRRGIYVERVMTLLRQHKPQRLQA